MKEYIESICVSPSEFLFNAALILIWAAFMWRTLTPRLRNKWIILVYVFICFVVLPMSTALPSRSVIRTFGVPALMIFSAFICFKGRHLRSCSARHFPPLSYCLTNCS